MEMLTGLDMEDRHSVTVVQERMLDQYSKFLRVILSNKMNLRNSTTRTWTWIQLGLLCLQESRLKIQMPNITSELSQQFQPQNLFSPLNLANTVCSPQIREARNTRCLTPKESAQIGKSLNLRTKLWPMGLMAPCGKSIAQENFHSF